MTNKANEIFEAEVVGQEQNKQNAMTSAASENPFFPMISKAIESEHGLAKLDQLLDLQMKWEENEAKKAFNQALVKFNATCPEIPRLRKGHNGKFAGLSESLAKVKSAMTEAGLSLRWRQKQENEKITITCILTHARGYSEETNLTFGLEKSGGKTDIHALGSTISYLERYTAFAALGLSSREMDDDGGAVDDSTEYITEAQICDLIAKLTELVGSTDDKVVAKQIRGFCTKKQIRGLEFLPAERYAEAINEIEHKIKEGK